MFSNALMAGKNIEGSCVTKHAIFLDSSSRIAKKVIFHYFFTTILNTGTLLNCTAHPSNRQFYCIEKSPAKSNVFLKNTWSEVHFGINTEIVSFPVSEIQKTVVRIDKKVVRFGSFWYQTSTKNKMH